jgi:hypothetical protein
LDLRFQQQIAGKKRGKQPLWLSSIMRYHIQPVVKELGIRKRVSWHTFRCTYASLLTSNNESIKVVQELLRHGSVRITMDVYAQANAGQEERSAEGRRRISAAMGEERVGEINWSRSGLWRFHRNNAKLLKRFGVPDGIRTRVTAVRVAE